MTGIIKKIIYIISMPFEVLTCELFVKNNLFMCQKLDRKESRKPEKMMNCLLINARR